MTKQIKQIEQIEQIEQIKTVSIRWGNLHRMVCPMCGAKLGRRGKKRGFQTEGRWLALWVCKGYQREDHGLKEGCGFFIKEQKLKNLVAKMKKEKEGRAEAQRAFKEARRATGKDKIFSRRKVGVPLVSVTL